MNSNNLIQAYPRPDYQPDVLLETLHKAARNELLTCSLYQQVSSAGPDDYRAGVRDLACSAYEEDWNHYQTLQECICLLQNEMTAPADAGASLNMPLPDEDGCLLGRIEQAEMASIQYQQAICAMTLGYNYKVFDLAYALLNENIQHNLLVQEYLTDKAAL